MGNIRIRDVSFFSIILCVFRFNSAWPADNVGHPFYAVPCLKLTFSVLLIALFKFLIYTFMV